MLCFAVNNCPTSLTEIKELGVPEVVELLVVDDLCLIAFNLLAEGDYLEVAA